MPAATEGMITDCRPSLRCSRTTAERDKPGFRRSCTNVRFSESASSFGYHRSVRSGGSQVLQIV